MASVLAATICLLVAASVSPSWSMPVVYNVGDVRGWTLPSGNGTETYNHWAKKNHFQLGDVLDFKYASNDSVFLVNHDDYKMCSTETPVSRFKDGNTKFKLDRTGFFYFVSGVPGHCQAGQRMIARVVAHSALAAAPAKPPSAGFGSASSPVVSAPASSSYGSSSGGSTPTSFGPSPLAEPSGASRRALAAGFSVVTYLLASVFAMIALA
uniref:Uncharacterized protein n=1 Tax=Avena sativa TaxID=4498 RepID=A0ACD5Z6N9_AVESA